MPRKIQVSMETLNAFENEVKLATEDPSRILKNVTNKGVRLMLDNPGCEIEIIDTSTQAVTSAAIAIAHSADKKKAEEEYNRKQVLYQGAIRKLAEELRQLKKEKKEQSHCNVPDSTYYNRF